MVNIGSMNTINNFRFNDYSTRDDIHYQRTHHFKLTSPAPPFTEPYTRYTVWLHAKTAKHEGARSQTMSFRTDVGGPGAPELSNASCQADTSVYLQWRRPEVVHGSIDLYRVMYRSEHETKYRHVTIATSYSVKTEQVGTRSLCYGREDCLAVQ